MLNYKFGEHDLWPSAIGVKNLIDAYFTTRAHNQNEWNT